VLDTEPERYCEETGLWVPCALTEDWSENGQRCDLKFSCAALQACRLRLSGLSTGPFSFRMASTSLLHVSLHPACMPERPLWLTVPSVGLADQAAPLDLLDRVRLAGLQGQDARFVEAVQQSHAVHVADGGVSDRSGALGTRCVWPGALCISIGSARRTREKRSTTQARTSPGSGGAMSAPLPAPGL
jgi:hypothetical protein